MTGRLFHAVGAVAVVVLALTAGCSSAAPPQAASTVTPVPQSTRATPGPSASAGSAYLALGDSVTFGYRESDASPRPDYSDPASFVAYPELVGRRLGLAVTNLSCPGETTASFLDDTAQSNGCENSVGFPVGYRTVFALHVRYTGSQLAAAESFLRGHPDTRLVTLMIGANDGLVCQRLTADDCRSQLGAVSRTVSRNVHTILTGLRQTAGYHGRIVLVGYYPTGTADSVVARQTRRLDQAIRAGGSGEDVTMANAYEAFSKAARSESADTCRAGLLTRLSTGGCGIHPSAAGQALLARVVERAARG